MKIGFSFILLLSLCFVCFTQTITKSKDSESRCPQLDISSDTPYDYKLPITYELTLNGGERNENLRFVWTVEKYGRIISGQGTKKIKVETKSEDRYQGLIGTVKIYGLPSGCDDTISASAAIAALKSKKNTFVK
jgi:hypothetical protein